MFYLQGPTRAGKGTFTEGLLHLLGNPLAMSAPFSIFTRKRDGDSQNFDLAPLRPARFIAASESGKNTTLNEATVKQITGGDRVRCAFKHRDMFEYKPQFKIWVSSNHPVKGDVDDDAFWGRVRVIEFPNSYLGRENKKLKASMRNPNMLAGVLAWAVAGAVKWYASPEGLVTPWSVAQSTQTQRNELDHIQQWINECCIGAENNVATADTLYQSYKKWCEEVGHMPKGARNFGLALVSKGFERGHKRVGTSTKRGFRGLVVSST